VACDETRSDALEASVAHLEVEFRDEDAIACPDA
jgi:hypothetical protein